jgi:hypothetical protein
MKTSKLRSAILLLALSFGLVGCAEILSTVATVGATYWIMDHETDRALGAINDQSKMELDRERRAFIAQCMNENWTQKKEKERGGTWEEVSLGCRKLAHETLDVDPSPP